MKTKDYEQYLTDEDKRAIEAQQCLNKDFMKKLGNKHFSFSNLTPKDILDITCNQEPTSIRDIIDKIGVKIIKLAGYGARRTAEVVLANGDMVIAYNKDISDKKASHIQYLAIAHIFKTLILGKRRKGPTPDYDEFVLKFKQELKARNDKLKKEK